MTWTPYYHGDGNHRGIMLSAPPPWRTFPRTPQQREYQPPSGLVDAVNVALHLRRPLMLTGPAGSGKSTVIEQVAHELGLGTVLRWHITSRSTLSDGLYRYDALGRIHAQTLAASVRHRAWTLDTRDIHEGAHDDIGPFLQLGPLGTALLPWERPRALLIDEIDKSDLDLPSDLLDVLERGEFEIPELVRYQHSSVSIREWGSTEQRLVEYGHIQCSQFPFIVFTSNGERDFSPAFLRRCIRYTMPPLSAEVLHSIVRAHLGPASDDSLELIQEFAERVAHGELLAVDQLLNAVALLAGGRVPQGEQRDSLRELLLRELSDV
ncbi:AAA family ATPase [Streptomyces resistomycificus]|uniref:ATPase n=1 Tax=Streptomyces resistomycificus TaxID=67356 RepID=A0A0L8KTR1_9ACTN|nr:AAA family ATPase [Streptomyces resistomycificus]KOG29338.1 ATPase [Streptomyces resistomycificus]KUO01671.1 ATPase [Streptomyces resistomycificus]